MKQHGWFPLIWMGVYGLLITAYMPCPASAAAPAIRWHGLTVNTAGVLEKDGYPYHGIGVNFVGALQRLLVNPNDPSVSRDFKELKAYHIPFVRFPALAAWGTTARCRKYIVNVYEGNPGRYFRAMDKLCAIAERNHVGLIPSLFFTRWPNPVAHESGLAVWTNPKSRTYQIWRKYARQMVTRYAHSPAIWGWEFGNELNLAMDFPNAGSLYHDNSHRNTWLKQFDGYRPSWGYTHAQMEKLYAQFVHLMRRYDSYHIIVAGNGRPRANAWHNTIEHNWGKDTPRQWADILKMENAPFDLICVHEYGSGAPANIARVAALAAGWHKPVFVGEFGVPGPAAKSRKLFTAILASIVKAKVPLAAVWAFDKSGQTVGKNDYSITPTNDRSFMLKAIEAANMKLRRKR